MTGRGDEEMRGRGDEEKRRRGDELVNFTSVNQNEQFNNLTI